MSRPLDRPWWQLTTQAWMGLAIGIGGIAVAVVLFLLLQEPIAWYQLAVAGFWTVVGPGFLLSAVAQLVRERRLTGSGTDGPPTSARPRSGDGVADAAPPDDLDDSFVPVPIRPAGLRRRDEPSPVPESPTPERPVQEGTLREAPGRNGSGPGDRVPQGRSAEALADPSPRTDTIVRPASPAIPATPGPRGLAPGGDAPTPTTTPVRLDDASTSDGAARTEAISARPSAPDAPAPSVPPGSSGSDGSGRRGSTPTGPLPGRDDEDRPRPSMSFGSSATRAHAAPPEVSRWTTDPLTGPAPDPLTTPDDDPAGVVPAPRGRHSAPGVPPSPPSRPSPAAASGQGARHRSPSPEEEPRARHGARRT